MLAKRLLLISARAVLRPLLSSILKSGVRPSFLSRGLLIAAIAGGAAGLGGCAQQAPLQKISARSKEYFPSSKYGAASPRVVADGEPVPRGGGSYLVGKPYVVAGRTYYPSEKRYSAIGFASWYGDAFHGRRTANGEVYDRDAISAAHPTMPLPSFARVTNMRNHRSIIVRVNDRGPFEASRIMDVSRRTAQALDFHRHGTARVKVEYVARASLEGSDDEKLLATLQIDGPAKLGGASTMVADAVYVPTQSASLAPVHVTERPRDEEPPYAAEAPRQPPRAARGAGPVATDEDALAEAQALLPARGARDFTAAPLPPSRPAGLGAHAKLAAR